MGFRLGSRLVVGQRTLDPYAGVRILPPQPDQNTPTGCRGVFLCEILYALTMLANYVFIAASIFAQESRRATVRLNTNESGPESGSTQK
jgi:hypothetical protein